MPWLKFKEATVLVQILTRTANRVCQKARPAEPKTLDFNLETEFIPTNFLQRDIKMNGRRHIVFATRQQLNLFENAKTLYVDAAFKVVRKPFMQLLGIHAFVKGDRKNVKQVPLTFVLSGRRKKDYKKVFKCVRSLKQVMALPFLPEEHISTTFGHLEARTPDVLCSQFMSYVRETWLSGHWSPRDWSVYGQNIRTNNDVEGYHRRLHGKAGGAHIPIYVLIPVLRREAEHVNI